MSRVALVTGGTRGIGAAISDAFHKNGYTVVATYLRNEEAAKEFGAKHDVHVMKWDVSNFNECVKGVETVEKTLGPIDILVNNAGITRDTMFHKMSSENWEDVISTNLTSCFNMTRCVINSMRDKQWGRIINIASVNGQKGQVGQINYSAAKAGIIGFTRALAQESAAKGITVNAVAPGYINTEMVQAVPSQVMEKIISMIPVGRLGTPEEVARSVAFLASEYAGFITGATISLNGGQYFG